MWILEPLVISSESKYTSSASIFYQEFYLPKLATVDNTKTTSKPARGEKKNLYNIKVAPIDNFPTNIDKLTFRWLQNIHKNSVEHS